MVHDLHLTRVLQWSSEQYKDEEKGFYGKKRSRKTTKKKKVFSAQIAERTKLPDTFQYSRFMCRYLMY